MGMAGEACLPSKAYYPGDAWLHPLFWGPCLLVWTFWFVIRLRIYEFGLWLRYHDRNYILYFFFFFFFFFCQFHK